jgi:hypothetical protein
MNYLWTIPPLDVKENDKHAPDFPLHLSRWVCTFRVRLMLCNHCQGLRATFPRFEQNLVHTHCLIFMHTHCLIFMHTHCLIFMHSHCLIFMHTHCLIFMHSHCLIFMHSHCLIFMHSHCLIFMHSHCLIFMHTHCLVFMHTHCLIFMHTHCLIFMHTHCLIFMHTRVRSDSPLQVEGRRKLVRPPSCVKFCTPTTTTAVQMAAPVPEIMDTPSYVEVSAPETLYGSKVVVV